MPLHRLPRTDRHQAPNANRTMPARDRSMKRKQLWVHHVEVGVTGVIENDDLLNSYPPSPGETIEALDPTAVSLNEDLAGTT
jgi:hypothetical protein